MPVPSTSELFSFGDALFLYLEREGIPLNVACVALFEGDIAIDHLMRYVESKRTRIPRFHQRVVTPPFNVGLPSWQDDPNYDIRNHVHEIALKNGTDHELKAIASQVLSTMLDRRRPLWDMVLVHGLKGKRCAIVLRVHHALADGVSGVGIIHELLDISPAVPKLPKKLPAAPERQPELDAVSAMVEGIMSTCMYATQRAIDAQAQLATMAQQIAALLGSALEPQTTEHTGHHTAAIPSLDQISTLLPELASATNRLPFNRSICMGPQQFRWAEVSLDNIKAVKNACGATVNDVILAIVTDTIRKYAELHHAPTSGKLVRIVVPVNVRGSGDVANLGNEITFVPASIPLDIHDGRELVHAVHERMAMIKAARIGELVGLAATIFAAIPTPVQAFLGPIASQLPISACNTICTNVPGPRQPLYLLGRKLQSIYPYVPIGGEMGMNCAILTYDGTAYFGFTGDVGAIPDLDVMEKFVADSFAEICAAVGVRPISRSTTKPATKSVAKPAARKAARKAPVRKSTPRKPATVAETVETPEPAVSEQLAKATVAGEELPTAAEIAKAFAVGAQ